MITYRLLIKYYIQAIHNEIKMLGLKDKNFTELAAAEHPDIYKCPARKPRSEITESEFSYSTHTTHKTSTQINNSIARVVKNFFEKTNSKLTPYQQNKLINDVTKLFTDSALSFQDSENNEDLQDIVQKFQKCIPLEVLSNIAYSDIANLFQSISKAFQNDDIGNPLEMLRCVLEDTFDTFKNRNQENNQENNQEFIIQSLKDIIMAIPLGQLIELSLSSEISNTISQMMGDNEQTSISKTEVVDNLIDFVEENMIDGDHEQLEAALNGILDDIFTKLEK